MAETYSDIDLSLEFNAYKDFPKIVDFAAIKRTITNILFISSKEIPFDNNAKPSVQNTLQDLNNPVVLFVLKDTLAKLLKKDSRVKSVDRLTIETDQFDDTRVNVKIKLSIDYHNVGVQSIDFTVVLS